MPVHWHVAGCNWMSGLTVLSRVEVSDFPSGDRKAKTSQTLTLEKAASKLFFNFGKKIGRTKSTLP
jgi:hypothetical protein